jgi:hypothetical protein
MLTQQWFWLRWGILGLCWGLFCLVWLIGVIYNAMKAPAVQKRSGPFSTWIIGIVLFVVGYWFIPHRRPVPYYQASDLYGCVGHALRHDAHEWPGPLCLHFSPRDRDLRG